MSAAEPAARRPRFSPPDIEIPTAAPPPRRRSSGPTGRVVSGSMPVGSDQEGRVLPRAYVARRRSPRGGVSVVPDSASPSGPSAQTPTSSSAAPTVGKPQHGVEPPAAPRVEPPTQAPSGEPKAESSRTEQPARPPRVEPPRHTSFGRSRPQPPPVEQVAATQQANVPSSEVPSELEQPKTASPTAQRVLTQQKAEPARSDHEIPPHFPAGAAATPTPRSSDAELPIVQSVEPVRASNGSRAGIAAPALPVLVDQVRRTTERVSGSVRALIARSPRAAIVAALTALVLLGVAIGYAAGSKTTDQATSGEPGGRLEDQRFPGGTGGDPDSLRAREARRDSASRRAAAPPARRTTGVRRQTRIGGDRDGVAAPATTELTATEPAGKEEAAADSVATPPQGPRPPAASAADSAAAPPVLDSAAARASAAAASTARTDSLAAERDALRRELVRRRARLDSIARRVQELKPDQR